MPAVALQSPGIWDQAAATPPPGVIGWQLVADPATPRVPAETASSLAVLPPLRPEAGAAAAAGDLTLVLGHAGQSSRKLQLRLDPPELGRVEIHITPTEKGIVHAVVVAERAETHDLLRRHGELLARELGNAGYSDVSLSFSAGTGAGAGHGRFEAGPAAPGDVFAGAVQDAEPAAPAAGRVLRLTSDGNLDIRL